MEETITITRAQLADALRLWEERSQKENWQQRTDPDRFADSADYLIEQMQQM